MADAEIELNPKDVSWLDSQYITKILNSYTANDLNELNGFTVSPATLKGENFASAMHLLNVEYSKKSDIETSHIISFIVKSRLENELMSQIEEDFNVFHREAQIYTAIMQEATKLLKSIGDDTVFAPKAIYVDERIIVQENLKLRGYYIADVKKGFSHEQCSMILKKLAKFHAVSMVLYKKNPDMFRHHLPANVSENPTPLHDLYTNTIQTCIDYCKGHPRLQKYVPGLVIFGDKIIPKMINVFSRNEADRFHVLNHGDMWVNNIMFHKGFDQNDDDVLFVDYQEGFYGSPGIDWNFFIFSSWQSTVFENKRDELFQLYHENLATVLQKLKFEQRIPTIDDVKKEILNKSFHGLTTATCLLPILINEHAHLADPMNFLLDNPEALENRRIIFHNPKFAERLEVFLAFFTENKLL